MAEKPPAFIVSDKRKFTLDGELRDETAASAAEPTPAPASPIPASPIQAATEPTSGPRLVTMPAPASAEPVREITAPLSEAAAPAEDTMPDVTPAESAELQRAYQQASQHLDQMLRQANPGMENAGAVSMDHVIQSIYLSAAVAMGAATEPGQKPRVDILGARQSIDMLTVLQEKTSGNLTENEQRLLQNALFEVRMMFMEITNAIAQQALRPPTGKK